MCWKWRMKQSNLAHKQQVRIHRPPLASLFRIIQNKGTLKLYTQQKETTFVKNLKKKKIYLDDLFFLCLCPKSDELYLESAYKFKISLFLDTPGKYKINCFNFSISFSVMIHYQLGQGNIYTGGRWTTTCVVVNQLLTQLLEKKKIKVVFFQTTY